MYNHNMKSARSGFTLIELVIAITIMTIIGVFAIANYKPFGEDQNLKNAVLDIQSLLRTAQTNASTNTECEELSGSTWGVEFAADKTTIYLLCQKPITVPPTIIKTSQLGASITIDTVSGTGSNCTPSLPQMLYFAALGNKIDIGGCSLLTITLKNSKTGRTKSLNVEKEGRIYAP